MASISRPRANSDFPADGRDRSLRRILARLGVSSSGATCEGADGAAAAADGSPGITALLNKLKQENISGSRLHKLHARIRHGIQQIDHPIDDHERSDEHTSELQSLMRISYAVFCLKKK